MAEVNKTLDQKTEDEINDQYWENMPDGGYIYCPKCSSRSVSVLDIVDTAPSIHYVRYDATYSCNKCNTSWVGEYGYRGLA